MLKYINNQAATQKKKKKCLYCLSMCWGRGSMLGQLQRRVDRVVEMRQRRGLSEWSRETHWDPLVYTDCSDGNYWKLACSLRYNNTAKVSSVYCTVFVCVCAHVSVELVFGSLKGYCTSCKWGIWFQLSDVWNKATEVELRTWVESRQDGGRGRRQVGSKGSCHRPQTW